MSAMALHTSSSKAPLFLSRTHDLTLPTASLLMKLSIEATDSLGRAVSHSTVIRALLRYTEQQDTAWVHDQLLPLIEKEIVVGTPQRKM